MGFRDSNQDLLGIVGREPARARERILDLAATQFPDGSAYHQFQPLTKRGNHDLGTGFNDDPLWLVVGVSEYVKETGDWAILDEPVPYDNDPALAAPLLDHLVASYRHVSANLGPHGLPLIGRADWNDCLNLNCFSTEPGESFQTTQSQGDGQTAESVFIAGLFCLAIPDLAHLLRVAGRAELAVETDAAVAAMRGRVETAGWDGAWFRRAYDAFGGPVGSAHNDEGQIYIEPQGMCVMGGAGLESGQARQALESVESRLTSQYGIAILAPAYTRYHLELGEISSYPPGYKENGGIFCHNNPWVIIAETMAGSRDRALSLFQRITGSYRADDAVYGLEPYVYAQMVAGPDAVRYGEAKNSWLTGTAAWCYYAATAWLLGVRAGFDGLIIEPGLPASFGNYEVTRQYRGATYHIAVENPGGAGTLTVDGEPWAGPVLAAPGTTVEARWAGRTS
jgi:cellobiose phosphorylase